MSLPQDICLHKKSRTLEIKYGQQSYELTAEYLRVYSTSAEVRGHATQIMPVVADKQFVGINTVEPSGNYALKIIFDDGHDTGIYTWDYLYDLCQNQPIYWQDYLARLKVEGKTRNKGMITIG